jgi:serine protease Do
MTIKKNGIWIAGGVLAVTCLIIGMILGSTMSTATDTSSIHYDLLQFSDAFAEIAERVNPSVVNITCTGIDETGNSIQLLPNDDDKDPYDDSDKRYGYGSGVIIDASGFILTSNHVVESASKIEVKLSDNQQFVAKLIGHDKETDLALIKVDARNPLPTAPMGDSDKLRPGQWVMAIGNPFVYDHTVTVGVISALNRKLGTTVFDNFIQTDAAINFGNSGGPLLNIKGEVIGINTLISSQGTGIGFSIPINMARDIIPELKEKGKVSRGYLGLVPQEITPELQKSLSLSSKEGVIVSSIQKGAPADTAGFQRYDVIQEVDGKKVVSEDDFRKWVAQTPPGKQVDVKVLRDNKIVDLKVLVAERPDNAILPRLQNKDVQDKVGMKVGDLTQELRRQLNIEESTTGIVVLGVKPGDAADESGIEKGDIILEANKKPVESAAQFEKLIADSKSGDVVLLYILRDGSFNFLTLTLR